MSDQIRVATKFDIDKLAELIAAFRDHLKQTSPCNTEIFNSLEKLLTEDNFEFMIAYTSTGKAVGYTQTRYFYSLWSTGFEAQIEDLFVLPSEREQGIGSRLVQTVIDRARDRDCHLLALNTNERNTEGLRLYTRLGFKAERSRWREGRQLWLEKPLE